MKVLDLLETDEWSENPITPKYLFKKQQSACHKFEIELQRLINVTDDNEWKNELQVLSASAASLPFVDSMTAHSFSFEWSQVSPVAWHSALGQFPSLKPKFAKVIKAKRAFEKAEGKYDESL